MVHGFALPRFCRAVQIAKTLAPRRSLTIFPHDSVTIANQKKRKAATQVLVFETSRKRLSLGYEMAKGGNNFT
jgi:hypothetical protein